MSPSEINQAVYSRQAVVGQYRSGPLQNAEAIIFIKHRASLWNQKILDLGCGAGRTSAVLLQCTTQYVGADYSAPMVEACRARFTSGRFLEADARRLTAFGDGEFDFVLFSYNGLDSIDHAGRLQALREVHRVLKPGQLFVFSSHNRNYEYAVTEPRLHVSRNPITQVKLLRDFWISRRNRARNRPLELREAEYAIFNDVAHNYALLNYYIDKHAQAGQLRRAGFALLERWDVSGQPLASEADDRTVPWIYYVAQKLPARADAA